MELKTPASLNRLSNYLVFVILYTMGVILWGAFVRATGSGAGCGAHWPLCNGEVVPLQPSIQTQIEFLHRISSGISLPLVLGGTFWIFKKFPKGSWIRTPATLAAISILAEALIGAGLVLFELVSHDKSLKRTVSVALHFSNTLVLLASLVLSVLSSKRDGKGWSFQNSPIKRPAFLFVTLFFFVGMAGAITALGDTLFPASSLAQGLSQDWHPASHFLIKLRIIHPILAISFVALATPWVFSLFHHHPSALFKKYGILLIFLLCLNISIGIWNLVSLAPTSLQLLHLCMALTVWIFWIIFLDHALIQEKTRGTSP